MVAKIDESEALGEIKSLALTVSTAVLLLVLTSTAFMLAWLRQMKSRQVIQDLKLEIESSQLAATIDAIPDVLFEMDVNGHFYQVLDKNDPLLTTTVDLLLNHTVMDVMPREQGEVFMAALNEALEKGSSHGTQLCLNATQGPSWFGLSVARKATLPGEVPKFIVLSRNITLQKQAESELLLHRDHLEEIVAERTAESVKARVEAERASQAKSIFLTNMSHELRTPMHAILSFSSMGSERSKDAEDDTTKKLHQYFDRITQSGNRLLMFVNDLLDLSKLEAEKMVLDIRRNDLHKIVTEVCDEMLLVAERKQITLDCQAVPAALMVNCDRVRLGQLLSNLLSNAIKFSPVMSTVSVSAELTEIPGRRTEDAARPGVIVRVTDEGVGVPSSELDTIFDKFVQSTKTATGAGGTGLGLAICREIIALHGGDIHAENNAEHGASLIFTLPLDQSQGSSNE
jgi:signal transduction histidine kinase